MKKFHLVPEGTSRVFSLDGKGLMCNIPPKSELFEKSNVLKAGAG